MTDSSINPSSDPATGVIWLHGYRDDDTLTAVIVDLEDLEPLSHYTWQLRGRSPAYPTRIANKRTVYLHREVARMASGAILDSMPDCQVHHINDNPHDARRSNLLPVTDREHDEIHRRRGPRGSSGYKGVSAATGSRRRPWRVQARIRGRYVHGGYHATPEEAARAADRLMLEHCPTPFLNFPDEVID